MLVAAIDYDLLLFIDLCPKVLSILQFDKIVEIIYVDRFTIPESRIKKGAGFKNPRP
jgi:hypothetical protein